MPDPLDPVVKLERANERLTLDNSRLRSLNKKLLRRGGGYDDFTEELRTILSSEGEFKFSPRGRVQRVEPFDKNHEEIACAAVSDLHLTETVRKEDSNGINTYGSIVAANRLWLHSQKIKSIFARHMAMYAVKMIWSPLLGDIVNGSIHPEFIVSNDLSDPSAVVLGTRLLTMFYKELKSIGLPIEIDSVVGNHPRTTVKMPTKRIAHSNLDWLVYEMLADALRDDDQFTMNVHLSQIGTRKLYDWNYVLEHGIQVRSGQEEDFEDRIRALFDDPTFRKATGFTGPSFDQIVIGNMHKPKFLERTIINGSYTGQNELGMSWRLKPIKACQMIWGVSKKHVRTWQYQIDLTDEKSDAASNPFSEYTKWFMKKHGR